MDNPVRAYDWGSTTALARLQGRRPPGGPEAELWIGAHPSDPSHLVGADGARRSLLAAVEEDPDGVLGPGLRNRFGTRLPFLLKILAVARPLSVQVHPGAARAAGRFAEPGHGGPYVDPFPKPELLYALHRTEALCGFRTPEDAAALLDLLESARARQVAAALHEDGAPGARLRHALAMLVTWPDGDRAGLTDDLTRACDRVLTGAAPGDLDSRQVRALVWCRRLVEQHPLDPLVAAPLLLDLVVLPPGGTLYVPAGAPHTYLRGMGVEIMGSSNNVLRAGLTHKEVAVDELLEVVDGDSRCRGDLLPEPLGEHEMAWRPPAPEFQLTRVRLHGRRAPSTWVEADPRVTGPQILLCTAGAVTVHRGGATVDLRPGYSAFVTAGDDLVTLRGTGEVFRAAVGRAAAGSERAPAAARS
jgi:mannose-6-phosphate isomerase